MFLSSSHHPIVPTRNPVRICLIPPDSAKLLADLERHLNFKLYQELSKNCIDSIGSLWTWDVFISIHFSLFSNCLLSPSNYNFRKRDQVPIIRLTYSDLLSDWGKFYLWAQCCSFRLCFGGGNEVVVHRTCMHCFETSYLLKLSRDDACIILFEPRKLCL